jgi:hypothetical protein
MQHLRMDRLAATPVQSEPYDYFIVDGFLDPETIAQVNDTFPTIAGGGSYPVEELADGSAMRNIIAELDSAEFEQAIAQKFGIELEDRPKMYSLRGHTRAKDGRIHTDSEDKLVTVLLYLNRDWPHPDGRLRILRNGQDLEDFAAEVSPEGGTLLVFRRSEKSWHGHPPFVGQRRALQMNWLKTDQQRRFHQFRHKVSSTLKRAFG